MDGRGMHCKYSGGAELTSLGRTRGCVHSLLSRSRLGDFSFLGMVFITVFLVLGWTIALVLETSQKISVLVY
jgi:hypothetical protein